jgi:hypothetical protein
MFFYQLKNELWKLFGKKRTYIGFLMLMLAQLLIVGLLRYYPPAHHSLMRAVERSGFAGEQYLSMLTIATIMAVVLAYTMLPLYVALIGGDMVSKEAEDGTLRMILSRPVSRVRLLCLKWLAGFVFSIVLVLALAAGFYSTLNAQLSTLNAMKWPADYHMHTPLCRHATGEPGITPRAPWPSASRKSASPTIRRCRATISTTGGCTTASSTNTWPRSARRKKIFRNLAIRLALEVDYLPGGEDWIRELAARHPWDYFIGSVHYVSDSWVIDDPQKLSEWKTATPMKSGLLISTG